ncbi:MAG: hypothetical protein ACR2GY_11000 [Phycisphaerales bacterium]
MLTFVMFAGSHRCLSERIAKNKKTEVDNRGRKARTPLRKSFLGCEVQLARQPRPAPRTAAWASGLGMAIIIIIIMERVLKYMGTNSMTLAAPGQADMRFRFCTGYEGARNAVGRVRMGTTAYTVGTPVRWRSG